ncbi:MAG: NUDIX hydrolase [Candidatus Eremiobacteraeota bacterium]|nr:NUDIX hydrolase [Candidatus Eremiobacteraeota bacterium]MBV8595382.1 NUDIX hydrolase [Candidatus Eremiobacteraeota bacterium]
MVIVHGTRRIYEGRVVNLRVDAVEYPNGYRGDVEIIEHRGGVAIIAMPQSRQIILVHQYRPAIGRAMWEVPAGKLEAGEDPAQCAQRELLEETGYRAGALRELWSFYTAPGFCSELLHLFVAEDLMAGTPRPDAGEQIETRSFDVDEAWALVQRGELPDAKTQIALAWARGS